MAQQTSFFQAHLGLKGDLKMKLDFYLASDIFSFFSYLNYIHINFSFIQTN